jgi:hypothetical protein
VVVQHSSSKCSHQALPNINTLLLPKLPVAAKLNTCTIIIDGWHDGHQPQQLMSQAQSTAFQVLQAYPNNPCNAKKHASNKSTSASGFSGAAASSLCLLQGQLTAQHPDQLELVGALLAAAARHSGCL